MNRCSVWPLGRRGEYSDSSGTPAKIARNWQPRHRDSQRYGEGPDTGLAASAAVETRGLMAPQSGHSIKFPL
jgi:hypothetical protein